MTKWGKRLFSIAFSFMFLFISIGYAQVADTLVINGTASFEIIYNEVFITNVELVSATNCTVEQNSIIPTSLKAGITPDSGAANNATLTVIYKITAHNYSHHKHAFDKIEYSDINDNGLVKNGSLTVAVYSDAACTAALGNPSIEASEDLVFYAKYQMQKNAVPSDGVVDTILNYKFGVHTDSAGGYAAEQVLTQFSQILNTPATYTQMTNQMGSHATDRVWDGADRVTYIGNVTGSDTSEGSDAACVNDIFGTSISLNIQGKDEPEPVSVLIKRKNIDNNTNTGDSYEYRGNNIFGISETYSGTGCEMTIYMTADPLSNRGAYVPVYIAVFTCGADGVWYQLGDIYEGSANVCAYSGGSGTGSFNTNNWGTTVPSGSTVRTYEVSTALTGANGSVIVPAYSYGVAADEDNITALITATDENANAVLSDLLDEAKKVLDGEYGSVTGAGVTDLEKQYNATVAYLGSSLTTDANGYVISGRTRAELVPHMKYLRALLTPFENLIANN